MVHFSSSISPLEIALPRLLLITRCYAFIYVRYQESASAVIKKEVMLLKDDKVFVHFLLAACTDMLATYPSTRESLTPDMQALRLKDFGLTVFCLGGVVYHHMIC